ncbi:MAG: hypothetical protein RL346_2120 [Verrucomicrobiota bacterium]|jgi:hypothetical protein
MRSKITSLLLACALASIPVHAREPAPSRVISARAVYHNPANPVVNLFYCDRSGSIQPVNFKPQALSDRMEIQLPDDMIVLYDKAVIDPEKPEESVVASMNLSPETQKMIMLIVPRPAALKPAYRILVINDSAESFARGESKIVSMISAESAIRAGEHKLQIPPGKITRLPVVRQVNDFNMAQTNFYYSHHDSWIAFAERQLHYIDATRRIFIIHATPGALQPAVSTIVDTDTTF